MRDRHEPMADPKRGFQPKETLAGANIQEQDDQQPITLINLTRQKHRSKLHITSLNLLKQG